MRLQLLFGLFITGLTASLYAQNTGISGTVADATTGRPVNGAKVLIKEVSLVTITDTSGKFSFFIPVKAGTLSVSCQGYETKVTPAGGDSSAIIHIFLTPFNLPLRQKVYMPSRETEPIEQSPVEVEKTKQRELESTPSSDFYQDLGDLKGVDVVSTSAFLNVLSIDGFASSNQLGVKQFIDGADNESPVFNAPFGNMNGVNSLDLQSVEIGAGALSTMYGSGAMQGVVAMNTKSPYDFRGLSLQLLDGGTTTPGSYFDAQARYANTFGKENRFAIKITGQFTQMKEWPITNDSLYGNVNNNVNLDAFIQDEANAPYCSTCAVTTAQHNYYTSVANWLSGNPLANNFDLTNPKTGFLNVSAPGYMENALTDNNPVNGKLSAGIYYRFNNSLDFSATYRLGFGSAIYQDLDEYQLKNYLYQQPVLQMKGKNFLVRLYGSFENSQQSYNLMSAGNYLSRSAQPAYVSAFTTSYFNTIDSLVGGFANCPGCLNANNAWILDSARNVARRVAQTAWYVPGTPTFNDTFNSITSNKNAGRFYDKSALIHLDAQYNWDFVKWLDILMGSSYRIYIPGSDGTFLQDTSGVKIREEEINAFLQITKRLFHDRFKITAALNIDKTSNFYAQFSPRGAIIYTLKTKAGSHTFRLSASYGFRNPTIEEQYMLFNTGTVEQLGNLNGLSNLYTLNSVNNALTIYNHAPDNADSTRAAQQALAPITLAGVRPEQVNTFQFEYRAEIVSRILIDLAAHYSLYNNLIGLARVVSPNANGSTNGIAGDTSGASNILSGNYTPIQTWANLKGQAQAWGGSIGIACYAGKGITPYINYTYTDANEESLVNNQNIILPGFNTPKHVVNIGVNAKKVWQGLGFTLNWKWVTSYQWDGWFASGMVPSYNTLDAQVYYEFEKAYSTIRLGGSNLYNNIHIEAAGAPQIGAFYYVGWLFDFTRAGSKKSGM